MKTTNSFLWTASTICFVLAMSFTSCSSSKQTDKTNYDANVAFVNSQLTYQINTISKDTTHFLNPVTVMPNGETYYCEPTDWCSGFFVGTLWLASEMSGDSLLQAKAVDYTKEIEEVKNITWHHDVGFIINSSFGNAYDVTHDSYYKNVIIQAAKSLSTRFRPKAGIIQSWDVNGGWQSERGWECPVIIDNMMNLELMFKATEYSGDSIYYNIANKHAETTLKNHFRSDASCYHVVDYSLEDGHVRGKHTAQGYADNSVWSRGQVWAIYGYTLCYRYTKNPKYLEQALKTADFMMHHPAMPKDHIPYWDMDAPKIPNEFRDVSSAACMASALYELGAYSADRCDELRKYADSMMASLATPEYRAEVGGNNGFLLKHSVGSIPHNSQIDVPLNYADYYYVEALKRQHLTIAELLKTLH